MLVPHDTDVQSWYGSLLYDKARSPSMPRDASYYYYSLASQAFEAVLRSNRSSDDTLRNEVRRKAVKAEMAIGRFSDARDHLENHLLEGIPRR